MDSEPYVHCVDNVKQSDSPQNREAWTVEDYFAAMDNMPIVYSVGNIIPQSDPAIRVYTVFAMCGCDVGKPHLVSPSIHSIHRINSLPEALEWLYQAILDRGIDKEADSNGKI